MTDIQNLKNLALDGIFHKMAHDEIGFYPTAVNGGDKPYEKRTERMEGWNDAVSQYAENYMTLKKWYSNIDERLKELLTNLILNNKISINTNGTECSISVNCSDVFFWGCSDSEDIELEELEALKECLEYDPRTGDILWISRKRRERPQGAFYTYIDKDKWPLFHVAGPEREIGLGNPCAPGDYKKS